MNRITTNLENPDAQKPLEETSGGAAASSSDGGAATDGKLSLKQSTPEELEERKKAMEEKIRLARVKKEAEEKRQARERELQRRESGKKMVEAAASLEDAKRRKMVEQRKKEKEEDRLARERIREQIRLDKLNRAAKLNPASAASTEPAAAPAAAAAAPAAAPAAPAKEYDSCVVQIRQLNGQPIKGDFKPSDTLNQVAQWVDANRTDGGGPFAFQQPFPRVTYTAGDMGKTLKDLALVPRAQLLLIRP